MEDILDVTNRTQYDESIIKLSYHSYVPHNTLTLSNSDEIRICINNQDLITLPSQSFLYIKGELENHAKGHFINNFGAFLFSEARYEVSGKEVDIVRNPGIATTMKHLCALKKSWRYSNAGIDTDENLKALHKDGKFSICLPLSMLMGVFDDYNKVLINVKQELILKRARNDANCTLTTAAAATPDVTTSIKLEAIQWVMPHVTPSDRERLTLHNLMLQNKLLQIPFRSSELHQYPGFPNTTRTTWNIKTTNQLEKPRYVIFGFQTNRDNQARTRTDRFDHCKLKNLKVYLNSEYYPYNDLNLDFTTNEVSKAYEMLARFRESYYNLEADPLINRNDYVTKYPLIVIDCSKQNESIKEGIVDIKIEVETHDNIPESTTAYCLIIHDKMFEYNPLTNEINKV